MTLLTLSYRAAAGTLFGLVGFGVVSYLQLSLTQRFDAWTLPLMLALGLALAWRRPPLAPAAASPAPRWLVAGLLLSVLAILVALTYGSLVTESRHWDGVVAWELKAAYLATEPSLTQDFFARPQVFHPSRDYPLLQPLCLAAGHRLLGPGLGRLLFPLLYLVAIALVGVAVRARAARSWLGPATAWAFAVTPLLVNPTMGGVDSGFADLSLATSLGAIAAALALRDRWLLVAGTALVVFFKPEGLAYGALPVVVLWCFGRRREMHAALLGWLGAAAAWLPLQHALHVRGPAVAEWPLWLALAAVALVVSGADVAATRIRWPLRARVIAVAVALPLTMLAVPAIALAAGSEGNTISQYFADLGRPFERMPRVPGILAGFFDYAVAKLRLALTFPLWFALLVWFALRRRRPGAPAVWVFSALGLVSLLSAFLLSPEPELDHHLKSSMSRLLLHWLPAVWIANGLGLSDVLGGAATERAGR